MDTDTVLKEIERRAWMVRKPLYKVCALAGVAPSTISRWRAGSEASPTTLGKLEGVLDRLEKERVG